MGLEHPKDFNLFLFLLPQSLQRSRNNDAILELEAANRQGSLANVLS